ncbi:MAG: M28 family metallopeptidase [Gammaproteobacteria bacterium]
MKLVKYALLINLFLLFGCSNEKIIEEDNLHKHTMILSSDKFGGREPGSLGGELTKNYIKDEFKSYGLKPINDKYLLEVPLSKMKVDLTQSFLSIEVNGKNKNLIPGKEAVFWSKRVQESININNSDLIFMGYGVIAPEYEWNDYEGIDVKGKTLVILINDPGFGTKDPNLFNGKAMTYYGRWVYKFEEAARQGAEAMIIIHDTEPAAYPWQVVETSWSGKQIDLKRPDLGASRIKLEGWITYDIATELFNNSGLDLEEQKLNALSRDFKPIPMKGLKLNAQLRNDLSFSTSHNIAAVKEGSVRPDEYVLLMAHWDHLGTREGHSPNNDQIYNGAVDNASGVAGILELANYFGTKETERSLLFLAVTAEESGLLGSQYFGEYPPVELANIVAGYNFDGVLPVGKTKDVIVVGYGASELEDILKEELDKVGKYITPDPFPEKGYFYRSDHISLAKKGVPMLYADGGVDKIVGGVEAGSKIANAYTANDYHQPSDEYNPDWDLSGFNDQLTITSKMVLRIANSEEWPKWYQGNEFKAIREASQK